MSENDKMAVFEGKCRRFRNSSECLKTHCASNNWPIWTQKGAKRSVKMWLPTSTRVFSKIFCCTWMVGCQKLAQYIRTYVIPRTVYFNWICTQADCNSVSKYLNQTLITLISWYMIALIFNMWKIWFLYWP